MAFKLSDVLAILKNRVRIDDEMMPEAERLNVIRDALQHFSTDRQRTITDDTISGTDPFALPPDFSIGWSIIRQIETPIGRTPPIRVREGRDWEIIETGSGSKITFISFTPDLPFRLTYYAQHELQDLATVPGDDVASATTIPSAHFRAFGLLVNHYGALSAAAAFAGFETNALAEDTVNYRTKEQEWRSVAEKLLEDYDRIVKNNDEGVIEIMDMDVPPLLGRVPRMWHPTRRRSHQR